MLRQVRGSQASKPFARSDAHATCTPFVLATPIPATISAIEHLGCAAIQRNKASCLVVAGLSSCGVLPPVSGLGFLRAGAA